MSVLITTPAFLWPFVFIMQLALSLRGHRSRLENGPKADGPPPFLDIGQVMAAPSDMQLRSDDSQMFGVSLRYLKQSAGQSRRQEGRGACESGESGWSERLGSE